MRKKFFVQYTLGHQRREFTKSFTRKQANNLIKKMKRNNRMHTDLPRTMRKQFTFSNIKLRPIKK